MLVQRNAQKLYVPREERGARWVLTSRGRGRALLERGRIELLDSGRGRGDRRVGAGRRGTGHGRNGGRGRKRRRGRRRRARCKENSEGMGWRQVSIPLMVGEVRCARQRQARTATSAAVRSRPARSSRLHPRSLPTLKSLTAGAHGVNRDVAVRAARGALVTRQVAQEVVDFLLKKRAQPNEHGESARRIPAQSPSGVAVLPNGRPCPQFRPLPHMSHTPYRGWAVKRQALGAVGNAEQVGRAAVGVEHLAGGHRGGSAANVAETRHRQGAEDRAFSAGLCGVAFRNASTCAGKAEQPNRSGHNDRNWACTHAHPLELVTVQVSGHVAAIVAVVKGERRRRRRRLLGCAGRAQVLAQAHAED